MAARSPARTSAGPEVTRKPAPISVATMPANEVLPRPGGPAKRRWSAGWPRRRAASSTISEMLFELGLADELAQPAGPQGELLGQPPRVGGRVEGRAGAFLAHARCSAVTRTAHRRRI